MGAQGAIPAQFRLRVQASRVAEAPLAPCFGSASPWAASCKHRFGAKIQSSGTVASARCAPTTSTPSFTGGVDLLHHLHLPTTDGTDLRVIASEHSASDSLMFSVVRTLAIRAGDFCNHLSHGLRWVLTENYELLRCPFFNCEAFAGLATA